MEHQHTKGSRSLWNRWILVNSIAWGAGFVIGCLSGPIIGGPIFGALVGISQMVVLQELFDLSKRWVISSILIGTLTGALSFNIRVVFLLAESFMVNSGPVVIGAPIGLTLGILQWMILRRNSSRAVWWVLGSILGISIGMVVGFVLSCSLAPIAGVIGGAVNSALTGSLLVWILHQTVYVD